MSVEALRGVIFSPDGASVVQMEGILAQVPQFSILRHRFDGYPGESELRTFLDVEAPSIVFLDIQQVDRALALAAFVNEHSKGTQIVAVAATRDPDMLLTVIRTGIREYLTTPLSLGDTVEAIGRLREVLRQNPVERVHSRAVYSFLPAKPGVGASTVGLNVAAAISRQPQSHVALLDFDFYCSVLEFMLKLPQGYTLLDAAQHAKEMDETIWNRMVTPVMALDVLRAGNPKPAISLPETLSTDVINYARQHYQVVCADLPGQFDRHTLSVLKESNRIFVITTPELSSLYCVRRILVGLRDVALDDRASVIVNRLEPRGTIGLAHIEKIIGASVFAGLPNDYLSAQRAVSDGRAISPDTALGKGLIDLARRIMGKEAPPQEKKTKKVSLPSWLKGSAG